MLRFVYFITEFAILTLKKNYVILLLNALLNDILILIQDLTSCKK